MIGSQAFAYCIVTVLEFILLTALPTNWNFEIAQTAEIFSLQHLQTIGSMSRQARHRSQREVLLPTASAAPSPSLT